MINGQRHPRLHSRHNLSPFTAQTCTEPVPRQIYCTRSCSVDSAFIYRFIRAREDCLSRFSTISATTTQKPRRQLPVLSTDLVPKSRNWYLSNPLSRHPAVKSPCPTHFS